MLDVKTPKVCIPAALFALLSPGMVLTLPSEDESHRKIVFVHGLVFMLVYRVVAHLMNLVLEPADLLVPTILFVLLSPGMLLTLPPTQDGSLTSMESVLTHSIVFAVVFALLRKLFPQFY